MRTVRSRNAANGNLPAQILSAACGPAWELKVALRSASDCRDFDFTLLDQDPIAISEAIEAVRAIQDNYGEPISARFVQASVRDLSSMTSAAQGGISYDFIYSLGLFDYLTSPVARKVLRSLFALLKPAGSLLVGNYHPRNPSRLYLDYWGDWPLYYRTEEEFAALAEGLAGANQRLSFESAGAQMFLEISKDC